MKRALDNPEYEPPVRDPKAIRTTVIILVLTMLVGGFLIVWKYQEQMAENHAEVVKGRSAMSLGSIKKNFQTKGLDGEIYTFNILEKRVTLMAVVSVNLPEQSQIIIDEMKLAAKHFKDKEEIQLICVSADLESEVSVEQLNEFAKKVGIPQGDKNWLVLTADNEGFSGFIKDILKLGMVSKVNKETQERELPDLLRIVDPSTNLRGEINEFKFNYYHQIEERTKKEIADDPSLLEKDDKDLKKALKRHQNAVQYNRDRMYKYMNYIIEHEEQDENFSEKNNSNRYNIPMIVFGGFILFILFMGYRLKKQRS